MPTQFVQIGNYVLDVALSEDHKFESDVTEYPVESGAKITDNIRPKPIQISIEGVVTDTPLASNLANGPITTTNAFGGTDDTVGKQDDPEILSFIGIPEPVKYLRSEEAYRYLRTLWSAGDTFTIRTSLGTFEDMAMTSFNVPRSKETTGGLKFTADFQQIQKVKNDRIRKRVAVRNGKPKYTFAAKDGYEWFKNEVTWRQADPAGSQNILTTVLVRYYWKPNDGKTRLNDWYYWSGPLGVPAVAKAGFPQKLNTPEVARFNLDRKRDEEDRRKLGDDLVNMGYTRNKYGAPYQPRKVQGDLAENQRRLTAANGGKPPNGDPNYTFNRLEQPSPSGIPYRSSTQHEPGPIYLGKNGMK